MENLKSRQIKLDKQITDSRKEIRSDRMDMSFGEIMNMYDEGEIIISPEFQRTFRWNVQTQTRFIESLLLGIPIPPIFIAETGNNIWELVDGLQRLSTILSFFGKLHDTKKNNLVLTKPSILTELVNFTIDTIPLNYKLLLKRAVCRVEVIRYDSEYDMRYELFNRLNTGGVELSEQEIRNCIFRPFDNTFNSFLQELSSLSDFTDSVKIRKDDIEKMYYQELVLRYFTIKNHGARFETNIQKHMDDYMLNVSKGILKIDYSKEKEQFKVICKIINELDKNVFKLGPTRFSTSMYDAIMINMAKHLEFIKKQSKEELLRRIDLLLQDNEFKKNTGSASSSKYRINNKIQIAEKYFTNLV